ncbi:hypothetical protein D1159_08815 [Pseudoflavonifractor sp. 524-17]|uniref:hypothetical protein n=1 Tax=Pseudoflavonifractor sp. 524-17 TaxID=2304577 RepID=UPI00137A0F0D|nr:hypothetical protein [Pseudoflavonifractor sp. 524-17]NCE64684.1 hypothetical protein [Pseudoflavonifractor sp. 524-17]
MNIIKEAGVGGSGTVSPADLALIHAQSKKELTEEEVYTFCVRLCDNEVDRDFERFPLASLEELAERFVGKCGVFDHNWSAKEQVARIYRAELVREEQARTAAGEPYCYLKGYAYMLRTPGNEELIAEIEGGIKREVSIGCGVERAVCSVCGEDIHDRGRCAHIKGQRYGGQLCWADLTGVIDAYEWSFVAVPAQRQAGVLKHMDMSWKELVQARPELKRLEREAETGRRYLAQLRREVARLGGLAEPGLSHETMARIADRLEEGELAALKAAYEDRLEQLYPAGSQLSYQSSQGLETQADEGFRI